jgi:hypothetical protein
MAVKRVASKDIDPKEVTCNIVVHDSESDQKPPKVRILER